MNNPGGAGFFIIGGLRFTPKTRPLAHFMIGTAVVLLGVRVGSIAVEWRAAQAGMHEYDTVFDDVPVGARVWVIRPPPPSVSKDRAVPLEHSPVLAAARRKVFVANSFTYPYAQPLSLTKAYQEYRHESPLLPPPLSIRRYDFVLVDII